MTRTWMRDHPIATSMVYAVVGSFPFFLAGAFAVRVQDDLGIGKSEFGWAVSAYFVTSAIGSPALGALLDRRGSQFGFVAAGVGAAAGALMIGSSGPSRWLLLAAACGMLGFANTIGQIGGNRVLAADVPASRQGLGFGAKQAAVPLGSVAAGILVAVTSGVVGWRMVYALYALVALAVAAASPALSGGATTTASGRTPLGVDRPWLLALAVAGALGSCTGNGFAILFVDSFATAGYRESVAGAVLAVGSAAAVVGRIGIGLLVDRGGGNGFAALASALGLGTLGFAALATAGANEVVLFVGVGLAFTAGWGWPGIIYFVVARSASRQLGVANGVVLRGVFIGAIAGAPLFATLAERRSYTTSWTVAATMAGVSTLLVVVSSRLAAGARASAPA